MEHPLESVTMMSYVPLHNATKEYIEIPEGRFMFAPELTVKEYGPVPPEINRSSSAIQSPVQRLLETTEVLTFVLFQ